MLKLIPSVPQGSWIIKQTVGSTPVLLGTKIATTYHRYLQITSDFPLIDKASNLRYTTRCCCLELLVLASGAGYS